MKTVFRESPKMSPKQAYEYLDRVRNLRNRVAHHEAIWNKPTLQEDYQAIFIILTGLGSTLTGMAAELDRFPTIWTKNPG
jgi:hypothetical protein